MVYIDIEFLCLIIIKKKNRDGRPPGDNFDPEVENYPSKPGHQTRIILLSKEVS